MMEISTTQPSRGKLSAFMPATEESAASSSTGMCEDEGSSSTSSPTSCSSATIVPLPNLSTTSRSRACKQISKPASSVNSRPKKKRCTQSDHSQCSHPTAPSPIGVTSLSPHPMDQDEEATEVESAGDTFHCGSCEGRGTLLLCDGPCGRGFHADCMPDRPDSAEGEPWYCSECFKQEHECFICNQTGVDNVEVFLCRAKKCGKFYHKECLANYHIKSVINSSGFLCPRHKCESCKNTAGHVSGGFYMCLRCPISYHAKRCMPHQSVYIFKEGDVMLHNTDRETLNASTDKSADDDPNHDQDEPEEFGIERLEEMTIETPPVPTFNPFAILPESSPSDSSSSVSSSSPLPISIHFPSARWSVPTEFEEFSIEEQVRKKGDSFEPKQPKPPKIVPPPFKRVAASQTTTVNITDSNLYGGFVQKPSYKIDFEPCMCAEQNDLCEDNCINRAMYQECTRRCPNGEKCKNQRISRRQYAKTAVVLTQNRGFGLVAKEDIPADSLIIEYCGEMITDAECTRRLNETEITGNKEYYFFKIDDDLVIDAGPIGNNARFLNHACDPNCKTELWQIGCQKRVGIFTLRDVPKGTELTYDYNFEGFWQPGAALKCHCGSRNCAGTLGGKKKTVQEMKLLNAREKETENGKSKGKAKANRKDKSSSTKKSTKKPSAPRKRPQPKSTDESKESKSDPTSSFAVDSPIETDTETDEDHMEMEE